MNPPTLEMRPARPGGPVLIYALSGLGKSTLAARHPSTVLDADAFLYSAVAEAFPELEPRAQLRAWRALCQRKPWVTGGAELEMWASVRQRFVGPFVAAMLDDSYCLVLTSLRHPPWYVSAYYGIERGRYLEHLQLVGRAVDNGQSEAMNERLEGEAPLVRLKAGEFLGERLELRALLSPRRSDQG